MITPDIFLCRKSCLPVVILGLTLAGCATQPSVSPGLVNATPSADLGQSGYEDGLERPYVLRATDIIQVIVFREEALSLDEVVIGADGEIAMPLVGAIDAAGSSTEALALRIENLLNERYLRDASVAVNVVSYASHRVTVEGSVEAPGIFTFQPGTRLSGAIALAEGPTRVADRSEIAVFRQVDEGIAVAKFDYGALQAGEMLDPVLMPGDRVVVGTDGLSQFWQDLLRALPAFALFTNVNI